MKHQILIVGSVHLAGSCDLNGQKRDGIFDENTQQEIEELRSRLAGFAPTKIAVEWEKGSQPLLDHQFQSYLRGNFSLTENEVHQIAFPLAKQLDLPQIHGVDWMERGVGLRGYGDIYDYMAEKEPELFERLHKLEEAMAQPGESCSILELFRSINSQESMETANTFYVDHALIGVEDGYYGIGWLVWWYQRNLILFANLAKLVTPERQERVLLLIGGSHRGILSGFLEQSGLFDVVDPLDYL